LNFKERCVKVPIYEYECESCGKRFEILQKFNDKPLTKCPDCGEKIHKLISHTSFVLKGTGWYVTDYARPEKKRLERSGSKPPARIKSKTEKKPEKKVPAKN
jgi:putative FmdB family regulatory protein